ncbi:MAG: hypothetical protein KAT43_02135 [Nanoarchaeota archaeon]|nr:hypothetical protein [Nanoarchaeota archaeon]
MIKSEERRALEADIRKTYETAMNTALDIVKEEFGFVDKDTFAEAANDSKFVGCMQANIRGLQLHYNECYRRLEELEKREEYFGMHAYANQLDMIAGLLSCRDICHYPFSGVDFYWARIFQRTFFEDMAFDGKDYPDNWWDIETYTHKKREEIISLMKKIGIIPLFARIELLSGDAEVSKPSNRFNNKYTTLLVKGGHDILDYLRRRFKDEELEYGTILAVDPSNPRSELIQGICERGYTMTGAIEGTGIIAPFSMELKNIYIFRKGEYPLIT